MLGHTTGLRLDKTYRRVNVVYTGLTEGCKLSIGDIKGTVVINDDITHCYIILLGITYMKKSAGGLVHEHLCHKLGVLYSALGMVEVMNYIAKTAAESPDEPVILNVNAYIHNQLPEMKLSYVPDSHESHLDNNGTSTFGVMNADQAPAVIGPRLLDDVWCRSDMGTALLCTGCMMLHHNCPQTCGSRLASMKLPKGTQVVDAALGSSGYRMVYTVSASGMPDC